MTHCVYWIHLSEHIDKQQGYIGVTKDFKRRMRDHQHQRGESYHLYNASNLYGWLNLVQEVIFVGSEEECYALELQLRPTQGLGWNIIAGGTRPPSRKGCKNSLEHNRKVSLAKTGKPTGITSDKVRSTRAYLNKMIARTVKGTDTFGNTVTLKGNEQIQAAGFSRVCIGYCLRGKQPTHKGYSWCVVND